MRISAGVTTFLNPYLSPYCLAYTIQQQEGGLDILFCHAPTVIPIAPGHQHTLVFQSARLVPSLDQLSKRRVTLDDVRSIQGDP